MRPLRRERERLARAENDVFFRLAHENADTAFEHVKRVLHVAVVMPRNLLRRRKLELVDAKPGTLRVPRAPLHRIQTRCVFHAFHKPLTVAIPSIVIVSDPMRCAKMSDIAHPYCCR
jgi:hypothetical protein